MIVRIATVFAGAGTVENIVAGKSIEFAAEDALLSIAAATTAATATMTARLTDEVVMDDSVLPVAAAPAPIMPDHLLVVRQPVARGDHLILRVVASAAMTVTTAIDVSPI